MTPQANLTNTQKFDHRKGRRLTPPTPAAAVQRAALWEMWAEWPVAIIGWSTVVTLQCLHEKEVSRVVTFAIFESCYEPVEKVGSSIVVKAF